MRRQRRGQLFIESLAFPISVDGLEIVASPYLVVQRRAGRTTSGMERKAAKGLWTGGARPLGYLIDRTLDKLVPDPVEEVTVRRIFNLYTHDRLGTQAIATLLNSEGVRTRKGKPWSQHTVTVVLTPWRKALS
jgi:DNA invertase Pin-like site-specific DNA recombinase